MKNKILLLVFFAIQFYGFAGQPDIDLKGRMATFTNLQGKLYSGVGLRSANVEGVIYDLPSGAVGLVSFTNLAPQLLETWKIPTNRIALSAEYIMRRKAAAAAAAAQKLKAQQDKAAAAVAAYQVREEASRVARSNAQAQIKWTQEHTVIIREPPHRNALQRIGAF